MNIQKYSKTTMIKRLADEGFSVVPYSVVKGKELTDNFLANYLNVRRSNTDYAIDGVVIDVDSKHKRAAMNPTRDTLNPAYSIKYKVADASNIATATVTNVEWNISKHGYLKPRVQIEPVELVGVTVCNCTGFNAKFIYDNKIGPGSKIKITRAGDVVPYILEIVEPSIPQMPGSVNPDWDWHWNETGIDAVLKNHGDSEEVSIQQTIDFFSSIDTPHLKEGIVRKMFNLNAYSNSSEALLHMLNLSASEWRSVIGENGKKIHKGLIDKFNNIPLHVLMGSLPFFGRGLGKRKFKKLEKAFGTEVLHKFTMRKEDILQVEGFQQKTIDKIWDGIDNYHDFYSKLPEYVTVAIMEENTGGSLNGTKFCFTGFRNSELQSKIENLGGEVSSTVSGTTSYVVAKDPTKNTGKVKKATEKNIPIISINDLEQMIKNT